MNDATQAHDAPTPFPRTPSAMTLQGEPMNKMRRIASGILGATILGLGGRDVDAQILASTIAPDATYCRAAIDYQDRMDRAVREEVRTMRLTDANTFRVLIGQVLLNSSLRATLDTSRKAAFDRVVKRAGGEKPKYATDSMVTAVLVDANVRAALGDESGATPATGSIGIVRSTCRQDFTGQIAVAATHDTLRGAYGASLLAPGTGSFLEAGLVDIQVPNAVHVNQFLGRWGGHAYASVSTRLWKVAGSTPVDSTTFKVPILAVGGSVSKQVLREQVESTLVAVVLDIGLAWRKLFGDITRDSNDRFRLAALEDARATGFLGLETGLQIQVGAVRGAVQFYYFGGDIAGFSGGQVVAGFAVQANLFPKRGVRPPRDWG